MKLKERIAARRALPPRRRAHERLVLVISLALIAALVLCNLIAVALTRRYADSLALRVQYRHTVTEGEISCMETLRDGTSFRILFCKTRDVLEGDDVDALVLNTALQMQEKYRGRFPIEIEYIPIYAEPGRVRQYKYETDAAGNIVYEDGAPKKINDIVADSVIFVCGDEFVVQNIGNFYTLDESYVPIAYNGEEIMAAMLCYTASSERRVAYMTVSHGEGTNAAFLNMLTCAGYTVRQIDIALSAVPDDCDLLVISNPTYDFEQAAAGSGIETDIEHIESYLARGGQVYLSLDPYAGELPRLRGLLRRWGIAVEDAVVRDRSAAVTYDGYAILTYPSGDPAAAGVRERLTAVTDSGVVLRDVAALTLGGEGMQEGCTAYPLLLSGSSSALTKNGVELDGAGGYTVAAMAERRVADGVARIAVVPSVYLTANDVIRTGSYANKDFVYAMLEELGAPYSTRGASVLKLDLMSVNGRWVDNTRLEDISMKQVRLYAILLTAVLPCAVAAVGVVIVRRRRHR